MKWSELRRLAELNGWELVRFGKKHDVYSKNGVPLYIERHASSEVRTGLYHKCLKKIKK